MFEELMYVYAAQQGWSWDSIGAILFRYLDQCADAQSIPNAPDFSAFLEAAADAENA